MNDFYNASIILIISPEPWNGHFVSKHHYAITLAERGSQVYFLNPPDNSFANIKVNKTQYKNLWEVKSPQVAKGLRFYPSFLRRKIEKLWLKKLENKIASKFTCIWLFENSRFYDMGFAGDRLKIYHQVDLNQNFHEIAAAKTADLVLCTTDIIKNVLTPYERTVYKIHHAVETDNTIKLSARYLNLINSNKVNAAYVGNLEMKYLDVQLLVSVIKKFPNVEFHFIGTCTKKETLYLSSKTFPNVKWWGRVDSKLISAILDQMNVLLLTYQEKHYHDQASPHKVMEYLASGKVTVATYTDEYKDKRELIEMVDHNNEYLSKFNDVITHLTDYNSEEKQKQRREFAQQHTYKRQLDKIITLLEKHNLID